MKVKMFGIFEREREKGSEFLTMHGFDYLSSFLLQLRKNT